LEKYEFGEKSITLFKGVLSSFPVKLLLSCNFFFFFLFILLLLTNFSLLKDIFFYAVHHLMHRAERCPKL